MTEGEYIESRKRRIHASQYWSAMMDEFGAVGLQFGGKLRLSIQILIKMKKWKITLVINGQYSSTVIEAPDSSQAWRIAKAQYGTNNVRNVQPA
jgi:hypothetical protein